MKTPASLRRDRCRPFMAAALFFLLAAIASVFFVCGAAAAPLPFRPGEKLNFKVRWGIVPAGEAVLEVRPVEEVKGVPSYHFTLTARTTPFIDLFYKVRDRIDGYADLEMTHSLLYKEEKRGRRKRRVVVEFDWKKGEAQRVSAGNKRPPVSLARGSFDPLSIFYAFRLRDLERSKEIVIPVSDGKKLAAGRATVLKREAIDVLGKRYDAYLVEPDLQAIGGVFEKSKDARLKIWVTADERRIPVKIESEVVVGSFVAELTSSLEGS